MALEIRNVRLPYPRSDAARVGRTYTVRCAGGRVAGITALDETPGPESQSSSTLETSLGADSETQVLDGGGGLLLPSLCHAHIHLDKCYLLDRGPPLVTGSFSEALAQTAALKHTFALPGGAADLHARGTRLLRASAGAGVTAARAHVEVDSIVGTACVDAALRLKEEWEGVVDVQIALFAQEPLFDGPVDSAPGANAAALASVLAQHGPLKFSAVGSAPYVERTRAQQHANVAHVLDLAEAHGLHADFHLDYDLAPLPALPSGDNDEDDDALRATWDTWSATPDAPLLFALLAALRARRWGARLPGRIVTVGHATRLTLLPPRALHALRVLLADVPVHLVGLPQSDVYMIGRTPDVCELAREYKMARVALAVNNVGNAFTPQGAPDPLGLCSLGVALFQDATAEGCRVLLESVSSAAKRAIGVETCVASAGLLPEVGARADFVVLHDNATVESAALDPGFARTTVNEGRIVASRRAVCWSAV